MKYEVILFDADDTLFDFKKAEKEAFKNTMLNLGVDYDENYHFKIYKNINSKLWKEFEEGLITQENLKILRFSKLGVELGMNFNALEVAKNYMKYLADGSFLFDGAIELIEELQQYFTLVIITNGLTDVQTKRISNSIIAHHFKAIIISEEVKVSKPNIEIFELTLKNINYEDKSKVLMIGDSLTSDIQGGANFGIDTCWYNPHKIVNSKGVTPTYEISNFEDLKALLHN